MSGLKCFFSDTFSCIYFNGGMSIDIVTTKHYTIMSLGENILFLNMFVCQFIWLLLENLFSFKNIPHIICTIKPVTEKLK